MIEKIVKRVVKLFKWVSIEEQARRLKICATCSSRVTDPEVGWTCGKYLVPNPIGDKKTCGCILKEATKVKWKRCWQGKWSKIKKEKR